MDASADSVGLDPGILTTAPDGKIQGRRNDWRRHEGKLRHMYLNQGLPLKEIKPFMERKHGFVVVDTRAWEKAFRRLGLSKNIPTGTMRLILDEVKKRRVSGKATEVYWRGSLINQRRIKRAKYEVKNGVQRSNQEQGLGGDLAGVELRTPLASPMLDATLSTGSADMEDIQQGIQSCDDLDPSVEVEEIAHKAVALTATSIAENPVEKFRSTMQESSNISDAYGRLHWPCGDCSPKEKHARHSQAHLLPKEPVSNSQQSVNGSSSANQKSATQVQAAFDLHRGPSANRIDTRAYDNRDHYSTSSGEPNIKVSIEDTISNLLAEIDYQEIAQIYRNLRDHLGKEVTPANISNDLTLEYALIHMKQKCYSIARSILPSWQGLSPATTRLDSIMCSFVCSIQMHECDMASVAFGQFRQDCLLRPSIYDQNAGHLLHLEHYSCLARTNRDLQDIPMPIVQIENAVIALLDRYLQRCSGDCRALVRFFVSPRNALQLSQWLGFLHDTLGSSSDDAESASSRSKAHVIPGTWLWLETARGIFHKAYSFPISASLFINAERCLFEAADLIASSQGAGVMTMMDECIEEFINLTHEYISRGSDLWGLTKIVDTVVSEFNTRSAPSIF